MHIDLFLALLGFCHTITSLLKSEARLGGSFQNFSKNSKKIFAFPASSGILYYKGLETLTPGGSRADIVGKTSVYNYSKSILGLPGSIILLAQLGVRFQPGKPFLFVLGNANRKFYENCLTPRRQPCKTKLQSENSRATWSEPKEQRTQLLPKDAAQSRHHQKLNSEQSNGLSKKPLMKFTNTELTAGSKILFEHLPSNAVKFKKQPTTKNFFQIGVLFYV
jgi:hypothetical protein